MYTYFFFSPHLMPFQAMHGVYRSKARRYIHNFTTYTYIPPTPLPPSALYVVASQTWSILVQSLGEGGRYVQNFDDLKETFILFFYFYFLYVHIKFSFYFFSYHTYIYRLRL